MHIDGSVRIDHLSISLSSLETNGWTIRFAGSNRVTGFSHDTFDSNLTGSATFDMFGGGGEDVFMEFGGRVGSKLTFDMHSGLPVTNLTLDDPRHFAGLIEVLQAFGYIALVGLHATSAYLHDDMLRIFDHHKLVDTLRVNIPNGFQLEQNSVGVMLSQQDGFQPGGPGCPIPLHTG